MSINSVTNKITWQGVVAGVLIGIILAPQVRKVPGINRVPSI